MIETLEAGDGKTFPTKGKSVTVHYTGRLLSNGKVCCDLECLRHSCCSPFSNLVRLYPHVFFASVQQFDSSRDRNDPFVFTIGVGQVIRGWDEGVAQMSVGQRALIKIPSDMGYGARGAGRDIPGNADLVFDVELLKC